MNDDFDDLLDEGTVPRTRDRNLTNQDDLLFNDKQIFEPPNETFSVTGGFSRRRPQIEKPPKVETKQEPLPSFLGGTTEVKIEKKDTEPENDLFSGFGGRVRLFYLYIII